MATGSNICSANLEIMFTVIIMLFTTISFDYFITTIGDIQSEMNSQELKRKQLQANVNLYMQQYYENNFQEEEQSKQQVIGKLSTDLQKSLKREQKKEIISQIDTLLNKMISLEALQALALYTEEEFYLLNQKIKLISDQYLIFIIQGEVKTYYSQGQEKGKNVYKKKLGIGGNFGLIEFITGASSNQILKSTKFTQIVKIDRTDFIRIIKQNYSQYQKFCELRDKDQQKGLFLNAIFSQEQGIDKLNVNGQKIFAQNSFSAINENQRVTFNYFDKGNGCKEGSENIKFSEEVSLSTVPPNKIQPFQTTNKSVKSVSQKFMQRQLCFYDQQENSQKEILKNEINKFIDSFKIINQVLLNQTNCRKNSAQLINLCQGIQENNPKLLKTCQNEIISYDFEQLKDFINYFPLGNSKEIILRLKNQIKKKFRRTNISFLFYMIFLLFMLEDINYGKLNQQFSQRPYIENMKIKDQLLHPQPQDILIENTRQKQGEAIKSKDWEQVRNKRFQEEEFLWNDSQFIIKGNQEYLKTQQDIQIQHNQGIQQGQVSEQDYSQRKSLSFRNQNSRRLQNISKYCSSSRSRTIEIDVQNLNETSRINQIQELTAMQDQRGDSLNNQVQQVDKINKNCTNNGFQSYNSKIITWVTKLKLKLKNFKFSFQKNQRSRLFSREMRLLVNDLSDLIETKESLLETLEKCCSKFTFLFDIVPVILNSQLDHSSSTLMFQVFQFFKIFYIIHDQRYLELQLCIRFKKHYIIQLINLIFSLFLIGHIIS
ncbi:hypothetical protein ABPG72_020324 [Tetrahymena utriculariae]